MKTVSSYFTFLDSLYVFIVLHTFMRFW